MYTPNLNRELLTLFGGVYAPKGAKSTFDSNLITTTLRNGYVFDSGIIPSKKTIELANEIVGLSGVQANSALHKSWSKIKNSRIEELVIDQLLHYITTYGFEYFEVYSDDTVYIPSEVLNVPGLKVDAVYIRIVKGMDDNDIYESFKALVSGIALSKETLQSLMNIVVEMDWDSSILDIVKNRELKSSLCEYFGLYPSEPTEFLRYLIYALTGETLLIKNGNLISKIKSSPNVSILDNAILESPENLASIFFRYKPLFLAMKSISKNKSFFNRLRKDAEKMHVPAPSDHLLNLTGDIKNGKFSEKKFVAALKNTTAFRKIRLLYAIANLTDQCYGYNSILYRIRNGKGWISTAKKIQNVDGVSNLADKVMGIVLESLISDISENVHGKTFLIPEYVEYALPQSEKQFYGNIPLNSYVSCEENMIVGIHWFNNDGDDQWNSRKDLDFSLVSDGEKYGWNRYWRGEEILFSGDVTSAPKPHGASEMFHIGNQKNVRNPMMLFVNDFTFNRSEPTKYRMFVATDNKSNFGKGYMVDPNKILVKEEYALNNAQSIVGLLMNVDGSMRLYFSPASYGNANNISSSYDEKSMKLREYYIRSCRNSITLREILELAGATVITEHDGSDGVVDLSPSVISKESIISLFIGG